MQKDFDLWLYHNYSPLRCLSHSFGVCLSQQIKVIIFFLCRMGLSLRFKLNFQTLYCVIDVIVQGKLHSQAIIELSKVKSRTTKLILRLFAQINSIVASMQKKNSFAKQNSFPHRSFWHRQSKSLYYEIVHFKVFPLILCSLFFCWHISLCNPTCNVFKLLFVPLCMLEQMKYSFVLVQIAYLSVWNLFVDCCR